MISFRSGLSALLRRATFDIRLPEEAAAIAELTARECSDPGRCMLGLSELLQNAIEHGMLGLNGSEKDELLRKGEWEGEISRRLALPEYQRSFVHVSIARAGEELIVTIRDPGPGFDWRKAVNAEMNDSEGVSGRGIALAFGLSFADVTYRDPGNEVVVRIPVASPEAPADLASRTLLGNIVHARFSDALDAILNDTPTLQLCEKTLSLLLANVQSPCGFVGFLEDDHSALVIPASVPAAIEGGDLVAPRAIWEAPWAKVVQEQQLLCTAAHDPGASGNLLIAPIVFRGRTIGLIRVADKGAAYDTLDRELIALTARRVAPVLAARLKDRRRSHQLVKVEVIAEELRRANARSEQDRRIASDMIRGLRKDDCIDSPGIRYSLTSLEVFSGDIALAARTPAGELRCLVGDFTGHGLSAAIGSIPLIGAFYATTRKNIGMAEVVATFNDLIRPIIPPEVFCAAVLLTLSADGRKLCVWNGGLPPLFLRSSVTGKLTRIESRHLPLGIIPSAELGITITELAVEPTDEIILFTDGVTESDGPDGTLFGLERVERAIDGYKGGATGYDQLYAALQQFRGQSANRDDTSLLSLCIGEWVSGQAQKHAPVPPPTPILKSSPPPAE